MIRSWEDIPGWFDFQDIYDQAIAEAVDGDVLVEVGTFLGKSVSYLANCVKASGKDLRIVCVDSWKELNYAISFIDHASPLSPRPGEDLIGKTLWEGVNYCLEGAGVFDCIEMMRMRSHVAAGLFKDRSLSFVFIDGDHAYEAVKLDISLWREKVKPGGILAGHDYTKEWPGVVRAVDEAFSGRIEHRAQSWLVRI